MRRHDYHVDVAGAFAGAHLMSDYVEVAGVKMATRRRAYQHASDLSVWFDPVMVSIDLADFVLR